MPEKRGGTALRRDVSRAGGIVPTVRVDRGAEPVAAGAPFISDPGGTTARFVTLRATGVSMAILECASRPVDQIGQGSPVLQLARNEVTLPNALPAFLLSKENKILPHAE